jgi:hypothetical protein
LARQGVPSTVARRLRSVRFTTHGGKRQHDSPPVRRLRLGLE